MKPCRLSLYGQNIKKLIVTMFYCIHAHRVSNNISHDEYYTACMSTCVTCFKWCQTTKLCTVTAITFISRKYLHILDPSTGEL